MYVRQVAVRHISPLSVFRTVLALSLAGLAAWIIAVALLYWGLDYAHIWAKLNSVVSSAGGTESITFGTVLSLASLLGALVAVTVTILSPLAAVIYNGLVPLFGGITVKIAE